MALTARKSMSLLASDLMGNINFDAKQTLPVMDINSNSYNEGMSLYLQQLGVTRLDAEYNAAVKKFEVQLEEQELAARLQANLAAESSANLAVEAQPSLGTGAVAVSAEGRKSALESVQAGITESVAQTYQEGVSGLSEDYQAQLESILGKYDSATGTFENLANYEVLSNKVNEAMFKVLARTINPNIDTMSDEYLELLKKGGYLAQSDIPGEFVLNEKGEAAIDQLINSVDANEPSVQFGGNTLIATIAEEMAMEDYRSGYISAEGETAWESLSPTKREGVIRDYESWIHNNIDNLRLTAWDLYRIDNGTVILDIEYTVPHLETAIDGVSYDGLAIESLTLDDLPNITQDELNLRKGQIASGEIPNGSFITFEMGKVEDGMKYYYVKDDAIYETNYTANNPPPTISIEAATTRSFGKFLHAGEGVEHRQDKYVNTIIDAARAGRIPENTYINMNFGAGTPKYYELINGAFVYRGKKSNGHATINGDNVILGAAFVVSKDGESQRYDW